MWATETAGMVRIAWWALWLVAAGCRPSVPVADSSPPSASGIAQPGASETRVAFGPAGDRIRGRMYVAAGPGPHPTVLFLHGFPGRPAWPALMKPIQASGRNVLAIQYRGMWESDGTFTPTSVLEDVERARAFLASADTRRRYRMSDAPPALVGHSFGAWVALTAARRSPERECVAALALSNLGRNGREWATNPSARREMIAGIEKLRSRGIVRMKTAGQLVSAGIERAAEFDAATYGPDLREHPLLLVGALREVVAPLDRHHRVVAESLRAAGGVRLTAMELMTSHNFNRGEAMVADSVVSWLTRECDGRR